MKCSNCGSKTSFIRYYEGKETCPKCGGFSEASGTLTDSLLTRNRIRIDALKHEADTILPHKYDKSKRDITVNEEFIKRYPDRVKETYTDKELKKAGYGNKRISR